MNQVRKWQAVTVAALMAGATLAVAPALAADDTPTVVTQDEFDALEARVSDLEALHDIEPTPEPEPTPTTPPAEPTTPPEVVEPGLTVTSRDVTNSAATIAWDYTPGTDETAADEVRVGRLGTDSNNHGPWSTVKPIGDGTQTFTNLRPGTNYPLYAELLRDGQVVGERQTVTVTTVATTPPATTPPTTPPAAPTTPAVDPGTGGLAGLQLPELGWFSGCAGQGCQDGSFGNWRGEQTTATTTWHDTANGAVWGMANTDSRLKFRGMVIVAPGGPSNWAAAATGSMDSQWRTYLERLRAARTFDGQVWPTVLEPAHEMNGTWYAWSVNSVSEAAQAKAALERWENIADTAFPEAIFAVAFNGDSISGPTAQQMLPRGVDAVGVDYYNQWPYIGRNRSGQTVSWADGANRGTVEDPRGILKWQAFAKANGLPLFLGEYANNGDSSGGAQSGDDPTYTRNLLALIEANAGTGPGQFFAEVWFQYDKEHGGWHLCCGRATEQPNVANAYREFFTAR